MVSFTGSLQAGRRVASLAGEGIKKVCLELGGKSAFVVLDDAPFEKAIPAGVNNCMQNSGQTCSAWTRMLVPRARQGEAIDLAKAQLAKLTLGDPFDAKTQARAAGVGQPARHGARLYRAGQEGGRAAGGWRRAASGVDEGLLRRADDFRRGRQSDDRRAGRDLRAGARRSFRTTARTRRSRSRTIRSTVSPAASGRRPPSAR